MSWHDAHRFYEALRLAESDLDTSSDGIVRWRPEYDGVFRSPEHLLLALRSRWENMMRAQIDRVWEIDGSPTTRMRELVAAHPGLVRAVARLAVDATEEAALCSEAPQLPLAGVA